MLPTNTMNQEQFLPMPLTQKAIQTAQQFAAKQPDPQEAEQIYLNTLAVLAVRDYLQLMEIDTELTQSDSSNPVIRMCEDVADLIVEGLGKLECRPVRVSQTAVLIPPEALDERIGYILVEIDESKKRATLLGFSQTAPAGELALKQLRSLDELLAHLDYLAQSRVNLSQWLVNSGATTNLQEVESPVETESVMPPATNSGEPNKLNLGHRFENIFNQGWQTMEELFASFDNKQLQPQFRGTVPLPQPALAFRRGGINLFPNADVMRAKLVDLGIQLGNQPITLIMALTQEADRRISIFVQVHPAAGERYVPSQLKLSLLSELGETLQEVQSRGFDIWIQLKQFRAYPGTNFSIQIALEDVSIKEAFSI